MLSSYLFLNKDDWGISLFGDLTYAPLCLVLWGMKEKTPVPTLVDMLLGEKAPGCENFF